MVFWSLFWKVEGSSKHTGESCTAHMWKGTAHVWKGALTCGHVQLTCGRGTHVWSHTAHMWQGHSRVVTYSSHVEGALMCGHVQLTCGHIQLTCGRGTHVWSRTAQMWKGVLTCGHIQLMCGGALMCEMSHQSEILHSLIFLIEKGISVIYHNDFIFLQGNMLNDYLKVHMYNCKSTRLQGAFTLYNRL